MKRKKNLIYEKKRNKSLYIEEKKRYSSLYMKRNEIAPNIRKKKKK